MLVMDIIYNPIETKLIKIAKSRGCLTINGLGMFIHQGAEQFRLWTGMEPPFSAMIGAVEQSLRSVRIL
jgi:shikimate dehydrogenase